MLMEVFKLKLLKGKQMLEKKPEIRLNFQVDQKREIFVRIFSEVFFGGSIGYRKKQDTYYYGSSSFWFS